MKKSFSALTPKSGFQTGVVWGAVLALVLLLVVATLVEGLEYMAALLWIVVVLALLWVGNRFLHTKLDKAYPWTRQPLRRFFVQLLGSVLYSLACINAAYFLLKTLLLGMAPVLEQVLVLNLYGLLFIIPVFSLNFGLYFMARWKEAFIQTEKLREENLRTQFESLKTHIDPHFLFNNLNVLSSLIDKDPQDAHQFLDKFSDVYRYVLQHRDEELVELETELNFIHAYSFLFQRRLNKQLSISVPAPPAGKSYYLPPLSVQMLVENAIKHNKATVKNPLAINIYLEEQDWLVVRNTYQPKHREPSTMPKIGLDNIKKRFAYFSDRPVSVQQDEQHFTVKLPLLLWDDLEK
ncbi:histidine kinase [Pontibacter qinzhouensis]|uniref:Histidine kinase n=1 Tax=Pontibacter qinzhouensis TaxID=2603253 RepID=A0A5C8J5N1_9BACT|nr:histidine kinase [Pontibacter qinzhouensis]TXK31170.1 histidine kinase [Pontibacter qinzhouensis]